MENQFTNSEIKIIYSGLSTVFDRAMRDAHDIRYEFSQAKLNKCLEFMPNLIEQRKDNKKLLLEVCDLMEKLKKNMDIMEIKNDNSKMG